MMMFGKVAIPREFENEPQEEIVSVFLAWCLEGIAIKGSTNYEM